MRHWFQSRRFWFPAAAVLLGIAPLLIAESACFLLGWGEPDWRDDPFVGFAGQRPLFVLNSDEHRYRIATNRYRCFQPDSFADPKGTNEFRIFCLGGSTVQGRPFSIETSFTTWLELSLQAADPSRTWEVINCGGISYASYRLVPILEEVLAYQPDLIILYTGHNEFLEDRTYAHVKQRSPLVGRLLAATAQLRTLNLVRHAYSQLRGNAPTVQTDVRPILPEEVQTLLDFEGGLAQFHRDDAWRQGVREHFGYNLLRMLRRCRAAGVACWLVDPVCNLRNCPPFKSEASDRLTPADRKQWQALREEAAQLYRSDLAQAARVLERAVRIDELHAGGRYDLAKCYESLGRFEQAHVAYLQAKELDVCPLRITEPLRETIRQLAQDQNVPLIPVASSFREQSRHGIPGDRLLADHVHPSLVGHQLVAALLLEECVAQGLLTLPSDWPAHRDRSFQQHMESLSDSYFAQGQQRLENLRAWTQGRAPVWSADGMHKVHTADDADE